MGAQFVIIPITFASTLVTRLRREQLLTTGAEAIIEAIDVVSDELDKLEKDQAHCSWNAKLRNESKLTFEELQKLPIRDLIEFFMERVEKLNKEKR